MIELLLAFYFIVVGTVVVLIVHRNHLLTKSSGELLEEKKRVVDFVMEILHKAPCPICGSNTYVESFDLEKAKTAVLVCENKEKCGQKSLWKLEAHAWRLISPFRYKYEPPVKLELPQEPKPEENKEEEQVTLVFKH